MLLSNTDREVCCFSRLCPNFPSLFYSWYVSISTFYLLMCVFRNGPSPFFLMHGNLTTVNHKEEISLKIVEIKPREKVFACFTPGKSWHIHHLSAEQKQRDVSGVGSSMLNSSLTDSSQWDFPWLWEYDSVYSYRGPLQDDRIAKGSKSQNTNSQTTPASSIIF